MWEWEIPAPLLTAIIGSSDHQRYLDAWFEALGIRRNVILVVHDWGSALGFSWAQRHPGCVKAIVYMEGIVRPFKSWDEWPAATRAFFQAQRTPAGEELILEKNLFIEYLLPLRNISCRSNGDLSSLFSDSGPMLASRCSRGRETFPLRESRRMLFRSSSPTGNGSQSSSIPKLFIDADPGGFLIGEQREFCRSWANQTTKVVKGAHFVQEDSPEAVGEATASFVAKVLAGQIGGSR